MLGRWDKWIVDQASDVTSIIFFFMISCRIFCKNTFNLFVYLKKKNIKIKVKSFECPKSIKSLKKKIILGKSDAWSTIRDPAWIYLRLTDLWFFVWFQQFQLFRKVVVFKSHTPLGTFCLENDHPKIGKKRNLLKFINI